MRPKTFLLKTSTFQKAIKLCCIKRKKTKCAQSDFSNSLTKKNSLKQTCKKKT